MSPEIAQKLQEFTILAQAVDDHLTLDAAQELANQEILKYAQMLVDGGYGTWKNRYGSWIELGRYSKSGKPTRTQLSLRKCLASYHCVEFP